MNCRTEAKQTNKQNNNRAWKGEFSTIPVINRT